MLFRDRLEAGRRLAEHLGRVLPARGDEAAVLAIPRGGLIVAEPVAAALAAPLDVIVPRKLGAPDNPELAVGALALADDEELTVFDERTLAWLRVGREYLASEIERQRREILRREAAYRQGRPPVPLEGRTAVIVDDGIATGLTARAAVAAVSRRAAREVVLAAPVAPREAVRDFAGRGIRLETLATPSPFLAVGRFYEDFRPIEDEEVLAILARAQQARGSD